MMSDKKAKKEKEEQEERELEARKEEEKAQHQTSAASPQEASTTSSRGNSCWYLGYPNSMSVFKVSLAPPSPHNVCISLVLCKAW